jgi:hypothetical protein
MPELKQYDGFEITLCKNGIRTIKINRPTKKNAFSLDMYNYFAKALEDAAVDEKTKFVILTGSGDYFSSGNDLTNFTDTAGREMDEMIELGGKLKVEPLLREKYFVFEPLARSSIDQFWSNSLRLILLSTESGLPVITFGQAMSDKKNRMITYINQINSLMPGLVVRAEDSRPRGRGFESRRILDGCKRFASYYIKEKLKIKVAKWGTPKKYLKINSLAGRQKICQMDFVIKKKIDHFNQMITFTMITPLNSLFLNLRSYNYRCTRVENRGEWVFWKNFLVGVGYFVHFY